MTQSTMASEIYADYLRSVRWIVRTWAKGDLATADALRSSGLETHEELLKAAGDALSVIKADGQGLDAADLINPPEGDMADSVSRFLEKAKPATSPTP